MNLQGNIQQVGGRRSAFGLDVDLPAFETKPLSQEIILKSN